MKVTVTTKLQFCNAITKIRNLYEKLAASGSKDAKAEDLNLAIIKRLAEFN